MNRPDLKIKHSILKPTVSSPQARNDGGTPPDGASAGRTDAALIPLVRLLARIAARDLSRRDKSPRERY
jgi:hypothetical protein